MNRGIVKKGTKIEMNDLEKNSYWKVRILKIRTKNCSDILI